MIFFFNYYINLHVLADHLQIFGLLPVFMMVYKLNYKEIQLIVIRKCNEVEY